MRHALDQNVGVFRRMFASRLSGVFNILVIGIALSLPAGMYVLLQNAQGLVTKNIEDTRQLGGEHAAQYADILI